MIAKIIVDLMPLHTAIFLPSEHGAGAVDLRAFREFWKAEISEVFCTGVI
jgi:hypothetical protein